MRRFLACAVILAAPSVFAQVHLSDMPASEARSHGRVQRLLPRPTEALGGFNQMLPYIMPSPDQDEAGSCLYMAITGITEWWTAKLHPEMSRQSDGPSDFSERYIMNVAGIEEDDTSLADWRTDSVYLFNKNGHQTMRNVDYRFTKGWYLGESYSDKLSPVAEGTPDASYGTLYNWIDQRPQNATFVALPEMKRDVVFADPAHNQWNIGVAPADIVTQVKQLLTTRKSPVLVVYNHNGYWHAVFLVGYNDDMDNNKCAYTERFRTRIKDRADELQRSADEATDQAVKDAYTIRAQRAREAQTKIETAYAAGGGCTSRKGGFYIRDSIYPDDGGAIYDYDLTRTGDEAPYAKRVVFKEYDWLRYFANHISVVYPAGYENGAP